MINPVPTSSNVNTPIPTPSGVPDPVTYGQGAANLPVPTGDLNAGRDFTRERKTVQRLNLNELDTASTDQLALLEATYTPEELANMPAYKYIQGRDQYIGNVKSSMASGQLPEPSVSSLRPLENALRTKAEVGKQNLGTSDIFNKAGLTSYDTLIASMNAHSKVQKAKAADFQSTMKDVSQGMVDDYSNVIRGLELYQGQYDKEMTRIQDIVKKQMDLEQMAAEIKLQEESKKRMNSLLSPSEALAYEEAGYDWNGSKATEKSGLPSEPITSVTIGGKTINGQQSFVNDLAAADADMFAATGEHLIINESLRDSARQKALYDRYVSGKGGRAAAPGTSFHETGLAVDLPGNLVNKAKPFLAKYGIVNGLAGDLGHFSRGEMNPDFYKGKKSAKVDSYLQVALSEGPSKAITRLKDEVLDTKQQAKLIVQLNAALDQPVETDVANLPQWVQDDPFMADAVKQTLASGVKKTYRDIAEDAELLNAANEGDQKLKLQYDQGVKSGSIDPEVYDFKTWSTAKAMNIL